MIGFFEQLEVAEGRSSEYDEFESFRAYIRHNDFCTWSRYTTFRRVNAWFCQHVPEGLRHFGLDAGIEILRSRNHMRRMVSVNIVRVWIDESAGHHQPTREKTKGLLNRAEGYHRPEAEPVEPPPTQEEMDAVRIELNEERRQRVRSDNMIRRFQAFIAVLEAFIRSLGHNPPPRPANIGNF